jgi:hypothetical protein
MPQADQGQITVSIELPAGTRVDETIKVARKLIPISKKIYPSELCIQPLPARMMRPASQLSL